MASQAGRLAHTHEAACHDDGKATAEGRIVFLTPSSGLTTTYVCTLTGLVAPASLA